jgi:hypothetical protein
MLYMTRLPCLFHTPSGIWFRARLERKAARVVPRISAIFASGTLSPVMPSLSCSAADIVLSAPRWAAEGGLGLSSLNEIQSDLTYAIDAGRV